MSSETALSGRVRGHVMAACSMFASASVGLGPASTADETEHPLQALLLAPGEAFHACLPRRSPFATSAGRVFDALTGPALKHHIGLYEGAPSASLQVTPHAYVLPFTGVKRVAATSRLPPTAAVNTGLLVHSSSASGARHILGTSNTCSCASLPAPAASSWNLGTTTSTEGTSAAPHGAPGPTGVTPPPERTTTEARAMESSDANTMSAGPGFRPATTCQVPSFCSVTVTRSSGIAAATTMASACAPPSNTATRTCALPPAPRCSFDGLTTSRRAPGVSTRTNSGLERVVTAPFLSSASTHQA